MLNEVLPLENLPFEVKPTCAQITCASSLSQWSSQTVP